MKTRNSMLNRGNYGAKFEESDKHILTGMEAGTEPELEIRRGQSINKKKF